jgi:PAS domain S-box-containing protein
MTDSSAPAEHLDLDTAIGISQSVTGEIVFEKLLDNLMRAAVKHAGAERALLVLAGQTEQRIAARATNGGDMVMVNLCDEPVSSFALPETILRHVSRTRESIILHGAVDQDAFSQDAYIVERRPRSVFCLPLMNQGRFVGVLYLENNLAPGAFAPARTSVVKLLASQASVSIENSRSYRDLAERESRLRRLVDANMIGIFTWHADGRVFDANDAFLRIIGYGREDLAFGRLRWTDFTLQESRERDLRLLRHMQTGGGHEPVERELLRKNGTRVPVLSGGTMFDKNEGVAFVLDMTELKRAQDALNRVSAELAYVSRRAALSALTASIAHEITQPLSGIVTNASTGLRMLDDTPPDIDGARETVRRTIRDANRTTDVIARLRALFSKRQFTCDLLDLNEAIREVVALSSSLFHLNRIALQAQLGEDLPPIAGDRVQLQQVILNLLRNAADAMTDVHDRPRELLIETKRDGVDQVRLTVRDTGIGLSPESLGSLFDAFYSTKDGGMGIGLFVSRSIIERHHGRLWAEANSPGPGATFSFSIPLGEVGVPKTVVEMRGGATTKAPADPLMR